METCELPTIKQWVSEWERSDASGLAFTHGLMPWQHVSINNPKDLYLRTGRAQKIMIVVARAIGKEYAARCRVKLENRPANPRDIENRHKLDVFEFYNERGQLLIELQISDRRPRCVEATVFHRDDIPSHFEGNMELDQFLDEFRKELAQEVANLLSGWFPANNA